MIHKNPFTNRHMITKEDEFVGRIREIGNILPRIANRNSVSIVGKRRIGKSSLLYHLYLTGNKRLEDTELNRYKFLYVSFHAPEMKTPVNFVKTLFSHFGFEIDEQIDQNPLIALSIQLKNLYKKKIRPILLLDEFDEITQHRELFNDDFIDALRAWCNEGLLTLVTSSREKLKAITDRGDLTSPFWNIFANVELGEFAFDNDLNEQALFLTKYWSQDYGTEPSSDEKQFLISLPTRHPLKMQIISYWLLSNRELGYRNDILIKEIEKEYDSYFRSGKEEIKKYFRANINKVPEIINWTSEFVGQQLKNLSGLKDFI